MRSPSVEAAVHEMALEWYRIASPQSERLIEDARATLVELLARDLLVELIAGIARDPLAQVGAHHVRTGPEREPDTLPPVIYDPATVRRWRFMDARPALRTPWSPASRPAPAGRLALRVRLSDAWSEKIQRGLRDDLERQLSMRLMTSTRAPIDLTDFAPVAATRLAEGAVLVKEQLLTIPKARGKIP